MEVNQSEFARIIGVSKPYITKLVKSGKLKLNANGKLNLEESQKILNTSKNPSFDANREHAKKQKGVPLKERVEKAQELKPEPKTKKQDLIDDEDTKDLDSENAFKINLLFNKARAAEKVAQAKLRDIDVKIKKGELLDAEIVKKEAAEVGNLITQKLYNMVHKLSPLLVGIETQKQTKEILENEVEIVLEELNRMSNEL
jgi:phage terminase Nu1 subunit (DNA packaging protein)